MEDNLILVRFGDHELYDLVDKIGEDENDEFLFHAPFKLIPVYRRQAICSNKQIAAFLSYVNWLSALKEGFEKGEK